MPNGKPGDHWYTDVTVHRLRAFSSTVDDLIREIDQLAAKSPGASWQHPIRRRLKDVVEGHLRRIGYDSLASRSNVLGPEWHLRAEELTALEADVRALRESLS